MLKATSEKGKLPVGLHLSFCIRGRFLMIFTQSSSFRSSKARCLPILNSICRGAKSGLGVSTYCLEPGDIVHFMLCISGARFAHLVRVAQILSPGIGSSRVNELHDSQVSHVTDGPETAPIPRASAPCHGTRGCSQILFL